MQSTIFLSFQFIPLGMAYDYPSVRNPYIPDYPITFPQRKILKAIKLSLKKDKNATGDVSQFGALATALAATIGTGNIIGVATAIALGGPGAVLWCWLTGVFGISTNMQKDYLQ